MYQAMAEALDAAKADKAVRAVLITGQPGIFTSGNDIEDFMQRPPGPDESPALVFMRALMGCDKPVVAAVTGAAIGIGTTMLLHCDFVYVCDEARLAMPFVSLGLVPEFASSLIVPQLMGNVARGREAAARRSVHRRRCGGDAASPTRCCRRPRSCTHARRVAERFNALPPGAVRETKRLMRRAIAQGAAEEAIASKAGMFAARLQSPEAKEAFSAFFQKRKPDFSQVLSRRPRPASRGSPIPRSRSRSSSCSRRCWWRRRCARGAGRWCCPRRPGRATAAPGRARGRRCACWSPATRRRPASAWRIRTRRWPAT